MLIAINELGGIYNFKSVTLNAGTDLKINGGPNAYGSVSLYDVKSLTARGCLPCNRASSRAV